MNGNEIALLESLLKDFFEKHKIRESVVIDVDYSFGGYKIDIDDTGEDRFEIMELEQQVRDLEDYIEKLESKLNDIDW